MPRRHTTSRLHLRFIAKCLLAKLLVKHLVQRILALFCCHCRVDLGQEVRMANAILDPLKQCEEVKDPSYNL